MPHSLKDAGATNPPQGDGLQVARSTLGRRAEEGTRPQPVALEVPVKVHGARAVEGSDQRETFSETTRTVLVLATGAVIRLSSPVAPGQLLFLTNESTKKEVVCQVVKSKNYRNVSGYVELEFTEPMVGFWGMRFPGDRAVSPTTSAPAPPASPAGASLHSVDRKTEPAPGPVAAVLTASRSPIETTPAPLASESNSSTSAPPLPKVKLPPPLAQEPAKRATDPRGSVKDAGGSSATAGTFHSLMNLVESDVTTPPTTNARPKSQPASLAPLAAEKPAPAAESTPPERKESSAAAPKDPWSTAPANPPESRAASIFEEEGVPVPSWFDPMTKKNAQSKPPASPAAPTPTVLQMEPLASSVEQGQMEPAVSFGAASHFGADATNNATIPELDAPMFGGRLPIDEAAENSSTGKHLSPGVIMGALAAVLVLAAAGAAWYLRQDSFQGALTSHEGFVSSSKLAQPNTSSQAAPIWPGAARTAQLVTNGNPAGKTVVDSKPAATSKSAASMDAASLRESAGKELKSLEKSAAEKQPAEKAAIEKQPAKKPELPEIHLAAPVVSRKAAAAKPADPDPNLGGVEAPPLGAGAPALDLGSTSSAVPAAPKEDAPTAVGGDVKPAKLISSASPVYPAAARNLRISGDVTIDALIEVTGRVTGMKVISGPPALHQAAIDAVRQWRYHPATLDGNPVAMHMTVTVRFRLQ